MIKQDIEIKTNIVKKLSDFVTEYAMRKKVYKYLGLQRCVDESGHVYYVRMINLEKAFEHTAFYKKYKHTFFNSRGTQVSGYRDKFDEWKKTKHSIYMMIEQTVYKLFDEPNDFSKEDLHIMNKLYKELKNENDSNI